MTDLRKAAEMALEALETHVPQVYKDRGYKPITALRQALAQPEQEQKTPLKVLNLTVFTENRLRNGRVYDVETLQAMTNRDILAIPDMGKKALKEVMEALDVYAVNISQERVDETAKREHEPRPSVQCVCGDPKALGIVHSADAPCFHYTKRDCDSCESLRRAAWDRINELEAKLEERENNVLFNDVLKSFKLYAESFGIKLKEKNT